ncbi:hypothetical protein MTP99_019344 [Tenebrio molitor]|uniref:Uncharacterized protein n=1 Tax=Tenebrio molitor TaxID=7067 RepID=A0A8J6HU09_TENMO|nr:hypothetical protein GEV33_002504 [Tenebrio molitor]KAJ3623089.1 hypothetical protein MTP99_019344 [Tenebrio molitor]
MREDSVGDRRAGGRCRKSRAANHVRGVRDPQSSLWVDCRTPWRLSSGAASLRGRRGARRFTVLPFTVLPWSRTPSSSSEIEGWFEPDYRYRTAKENRKVLLRIIEKQPLSAERGCSLGSAGPGTLFFRVSRTRNVVL